MYISNLRRILKKVYKEHGNKIILINDCMIDVSKIKVDKNILHMTSTERNSRTHSTVLELLIKTGKYPFSNKVEYNKEDNFIVTVKDFR